MKAIIIDDEPFVREDLKQMLKKHGDVEIIGEAGSVPQAEELLSELTPDVVFLDIQLVGGTGFDLTALIHPLTHIIFFTSHDEFAVRAFEVNALDYLLKPVPEKRLTSALDRLRNATTPPTPAPLKEPFNENDRIFIHSSGEQRFVNIRDVVAVTAIGGNYTQVHIKNGTTLTVRRTMKEWEHLLPGTLFCRIHRSGIVNLEYVDSLYQNKIKSWEIRMLDLENPLEVSRRSLSRIKQLLENRHTGGILP